LQADCLPVSMAVHCITRYFVPCRLTVYQCRWRYIVSHATLSLAGWLSTSVDGGTLYHTHYFVPCRLTVYQCRWRYIVSHATLSLAGWLSISVDGGTLYHTLLCPLQADCLPVSCPYQKTMAGDGCEETDTQIELRNFVVQVGLTPVSHSEPRLWLSRAQQERPFSWMKTPCSRIHWSSVGIYHTNGDVPHRHNNYLLVRLLYRDTKTVPIQYARTVIEECLREPWHLETKNQQIIFNAEIFPYNHIHGFSEEMGVYQPVEINYTQILLTGSVEMRRGPLYLSKLYFCNQVIIFKTFHVKCSLCLVVRKSCGFIMQRAFSSNNYRLLVWYGNICMGSGAE